MLVVVLITKASRLHDLLASAKPPSGGMAVVVDASDRIVARSDEHHDEVVGRPVLPENVARLAPERPAVFRSVTRDGAVRVFVSLPVTSAPGWRVGVRSARCRLRCVVALARGDVRRRHCPVFVPGRPRSADVDPPDVGPLRQLTEHARLVAASGGELLAGERLPQVDIAELETTRASRPCASIFAACARRAARSRG